MSNSLKLFKEKINILIEGHLQEKINHFKSGSDSDLIKETLDQALLLSGGGKRSRAYLVALMANDLSLESEDVVRVCLAVEIFHTFVLIHDDINDSASTRRGEATIHAFVEGKTGDAKLGLDYGILVGDLLFNWSQVLVSRVSNRSLAEAFYYMVDMTVLGQIKDVTLRGNKQAKNSEIRQKDIEKTAYYTFVHPMIMGNILSSSQVSADFLEDLGTVLGIGFQIQDDLIDVVSEKSGKARFGDMKEGQPTQMYCYAVENSSPEDQAVLQGLLGNDAQQHDDTLMAIFDKSGALDWARQTSAKNYKEAKELIAAGSDLLGNIRSEKLLDLIDYLEGRMV